MSVDLRESLYKISLNYVKKEPYTGSFGDRCCASGCGPGLYALKRPRKKKNPLLIIPWIRRGWMQPLTG